MATDISLFFVDGIFLLIFFLSTALATHFFLFPRTKYKLSLPASAAFGQAVLLCLSFFLSNFGLSLEQVGKPLILVLSLALLSRYRQIKTICAAWRLMRPGQILLVVTLSFCIAGYIIFVASKSSVNDAWGSSDFFVYWATADYLRFFPFDVSAYNKQEIFRHIDVADHLAFFGRGGIMTLLSLLGATSYGDDLYRLINPLIVVNQIIALSLIIERTDERAKVRNGLAAILCLSPLNYFNLYFTYLSQAVALSLVLASLELAEKLFKKVQVPQLLVFIIVSLAASFVYEATAPLSLVICLAVLGILFLKGKDNRLLILLGGFVFGVSSFKNYGVVFLRLLNLKRTHVFPGWEWKTLPWLQDVVGLTSPLGGLDLNFLSLPNAMWSLILLPPMMFGLHRLSYPIFFTLPLGYSFGLMVTVLSALEKGIPNSSHMFVKALVMFSPLILCLIIVGAESALTRLFTIIEGQNFISPTSRALIALIISLQVLNVILIAPRAASVSKNVIDEARSQGSFQKNVYIRRGELGLNAKDFLGPAVKNDARIVEY